MKTIVLVGFMGAGKSAVGKALAQTLGQTFYDLDELVEVDLGMPIAAYFADFGEAAFRQREHAVLQKALSLPGVIATGGGIITQKANRDLLQQQQGVVYLKGQVDLLIQRIRQDRENVRPLAVERNDEELAALFFSRESFYLTSSQIVVATDHQSVDVIVKKILQEVAQ